MARVAAGGFLHEEEQQPEGEGEGQEGRGAGYAAIYGPTTGDVVRLGDTDLYLRVERDFTVYGDECKFGGGKVLREGMGQSAGLGPGQEVLEVVITNALVVDHTGCYKADVGLRGGRIAGIGKAGNPDCMAGVTPGMAVGVNTEAIAGEGLLLTPGGVDTHVHFICPRLVDEALASGLTTLLGGGTGPAHGTLATTCTPHPAQLRSMLQVRRYPMNFGFTGKGNTAMPEGLPRWVRVAAKRAVGMKLHEDWGTTPAIDNCLTMLYLFHSGDNPYRHAERVKLRGGLDCCLQRAHHPHVPLRGRGRRARPGHHRRVRRAQRDPLLHQPHAPAHHEHPGRAPGHADGVPPPGQGHPRGRGLRREPHPEGDHRGRGRAPRHRGHQHHVQRQPGNGAHWRSNYTHLANGVEDEGPAGTACRGRRRRRRAGSASWHQNRQFQDPSLYCKVHH
ncbi:unnamed protein product [Heterosigma akashiwo]